jgi:hypothetical protein
MIQIRYEYNISWGELEINTDSIGDDNVIGAVECSLVIECGC